MQSEVTESAEGSAETGETDGPALERLGAPRHRGLWLRKALAYGLAVAIILFLARGISADQFFRVLRDARPWWFLIGCLCSFAFWFFGDTVTFSRLFSYFHVKTTFREMLPANAAQYFLQTVNHVAGGTALVLFMRRRKGISMISAGCSMMFLALIDFLVLAVMGLVVALLVPNSLLAAVWYYPVAVIGGISLLLWFWFRGRPSLPLLRRIYDLPSLAAFRDARVSHYLRLMVIRGLLFTAEGFTLYVQLHSFRVHVPLSQVLAFEPVELFLSALPITPAGLGVLQAVLIFGFHSYGSRATLLTMGLAISSMGILMRLPLGVGAAGSFAREIMHLHRTRPLGAAAE